MKKIYTLAMYGIMALLVACGGNEDPQDNNIQLNKPSIEINYNDQFQLEATFKRDGYNVGDFKWGSSNEHSVTVNSSGLVKGRKAGKSTITVKSGDGLFSTSSEVTVLATNFLYKEPIFAFGESASFIKSNETRSLLSEKSESLLFEGEKSSVLGVFYELTNGKMTGAVVALKINQTIVDEFTDFLEQRYDPAGQKDGTYVFTSDEVAVGVTIQNGQVLIVYLNADDYDFSNGRIDFIELIKTKAKSISFER